MRIKIGVVEVWSYCKSSLIYAELKIATHKWDLLKNIFDSDIKVISLPYQLIIDEFDLYQNIYWNLMSFYMISALSAIERSKWNNIFILTFDPHSINFPNTVTALSYDLSTLNCEGVMININEKVRVVAFCMTFLRDILQQNSNAGIKESIASRSYWSCFINDKNQLNLNYNLCNNSQFYYHNIFSLNWMICRIPHAESKCVKTKYDSTNNVSFSNILKFEFDIFFPFWFIS